MLRYLQRVRRGVLGMANDVRAGYNLTSNLRSLLRYGADMILYRVLFFTDLPGMNRERTIHVRGGLMVSYRLNRGDIHTLKEVLVNQCYKPPFDLAPKVIVDLGANIGLTSLWFARRYHLETIIAVEPSPSNVRLLRKNLSMNGIRAQVVEAAIGPVDGTAFFAPSRDFNQGSTGSTGQEQVPMLSMASVLSRAGEGTIVDLVKMDIEGSEQQLLSGDRDWLRQVRSLIVEFHPAMVDYPGLIALLERSGFRYIKYNAAHQECMDSFIRHEFYT